MPIEIISLLLLFGGVMLFGILTDNNKQEWPKNLKNWEIEIIKRFPRKQRKLVIEFIEDGWIIYKISDEMAFLTKNGYMASIGGLHPKYVVVEKIY